MIPYGTKGIWRGADLVITIPGAANQGSIVPSGLKHERTLKLWPCEKCSRIEWVFR